MVSGAHPLMGEMLRRKKQTAKEDDSALVVPPRKDALKKRTQRVHSKLNNMQSRIQQIHEVNQYFVKVADSCPLVIEEARKKKLMNAKKVMTE